MSTTAETGALMDPWKVNDDEHLSEYIRISLTGINSADPLQAAGLLRECADKIEACLRDKVAIDAFAEIDLSDPKAVVGWFLEQVLDGEQFWKPVYGVAKHVSQAFSAVGVSPKQPNCNDRDRVTTAHEFGVLMVRNILYTLEHSGHFNTEVWRWMLVRYQQMLRNEQG